MSRPYLWHYNRRDEMVSLSPNLFVGAVLIALVKAFSLTSRLPLGRAFSEGFNSILGDLSFIGLFAVGLYLNSTRLNRWVLRAMNCGLAVLLFWYCVDIAVIAVLETRLNLLDMFTFIQESIVLAHAGTAALVLGGYIVIVLYSGRFKCTLSRSHLASCGLGFLFLSSLGLPNVRDHATSLELLRINLIGDLSADKLTLEELNRFGATRSRFLPAAPPPADVILLVVIESFSAVDSKRTSGIADRFPRFDRVSQQGRLFTNFIANHHVTEGGLASFFVGQPPMTYPGAPAMFRYGMWNQDSVVRTLGSHGYHSVFLSSASLDFREKRQFTQHLGFNEYYGVDDVDSFRSSPRFAFNAVSDHVLYEEALIRFREARKKHEKLLFVVETTSSHEPYVDPLGRENTFENVMDYVDSEFEWFFNSLKKQGLLNHALLVVTGDHRKRAPISVAERQAYGSSAEARIPLLVYGQGLQPGVDTRLLQQADLFRYMSKLRDPSTPLTQVAVWVEPFTSALLGSNPAPLRIFTAGGGAYAMELRGRRYLWKGNIIPENKKEVELELAERVARLQYCSDRAPFCSDTAVSVR